MHLGGRRAELAGRLVEVLVGGHRPQRDAPGVLGAGEELLREGQVAVCRLVALGDRAATRRSTVPTMVGTRVDPASDSAPCTTTSGFSPGWSIRNTLQINGFGAPSPSRVQSKMTEVLDCSPDSTLDGGQQRLGRHDGCRGTRRRARRCRTRRRPGVRPAPAPGRAAARRRRGRAGRRRPSACRGRSAPSSRRGRAGRPRAARRGR